MAEELGRRHKTTIQDPKVPPEVMGVRKPLKCPLGNYFKKTSVTDGPKCLNKVSTLWTCHTYMENMSTVLNHEEISFGVIDPSARGAQVND